MSTTTKTVLISGLLLAIIGYLVPDNFAVGAVFFAGIFVGGAIFVSKRNQDNRLQVGFLPLIFFVLLTSTWASIGLFGGCSAFSGFLSCSMNKIKALTFINFTSPMLIVLVLWVQQFFQKKY